MAFGSGAMRAGMFTAIAAATLLGVSSASAQDASNAAKCHLVQIAELKVTFDNNRPLVEVEINGHKVKLLVDTGSMATIIYADAAKQVGMRSQSTGEYFVGIGGAREGQAVTADTFTLGGYTVKKLPLYAIEHDPKREPDIAGLLGENMFAKVELEMDLGHNLIRMHQALNCRDEPLAYWTQTPGVADLVGGRPSFSVDARVNGGVVRGMMDSGAHTSIISVAAAQRVGVHVIMDEKDRSGGIGPGSIANGTAIFDSFALSDETIPHPKLRVGDLFGDAAASTAHNHDWSTSDTEMLIGADFYHSHRVLISNTQRKVYFTYEGGPVFQYVTPTTGPAAKPADTPKPADAPKP